MILRRGKQLEGPKGGSNDDLLHDEHVVNIEKEASAPSNDVIVDDVHNSN